MGADILKSRNIVLLFKEGAERTKIARNLNEGNYKTIFSSAFQESQALFNKHNAGVFIQDWEAIDQSQTRSFHQKLSLNEAYDHLLRILVVSQINPNIRAFANDTGIHEVVTTATAASSMSQKIEMLLNSPTLFQNKIMREAGHLDDGYDQKKVDDCIEDAYKQFPHDPKVVLEFGNLNYRRESFDESARHAQNLIDKQPENVRAMTLLSRSLMKMNKIDEGIEVMKKADELSPFNPGRLATIGDAYYEKNDLDTALAYYDRAAKANSDCSEAHVGKTKVHLANGDVGAALEVVQSSLSEEEAAGFFNSSALRASREEKYDEAIHLYKVALKALKTKKLKHLLYFNMSIAYEAKGDMENAIKSVKMSLKAMKNYQKAYDRLQRLESKLAS